MTQANPSLTVQSPAAGGVRELTAIALPMVVSFACETIMTFTDRMYLARLGPDLMNAAMAGGLTCFMMSTFFLGLIGYTTALVAQLLGAGQSRRCGCALAQALWLAVAAYPLILLARPVPHALFDVAGLSPSQRVAQTAYFDLLLYGSLITLTRHALSSFFSGIGRTRIVMAAAAVAMVVNVAANYVLIFGHLGLPALGIRGAAVGTLLGGLCGLTVLIVAVARPTLRRRFGTMTQWRIDRPTLGLLLRFGYPAGIEMFLNVLAFTGMILTFHAHGPATATAATIMFNWDMVSFVPLLGVQIGVTSLVGRYMGARQPDIAHRATRSGLLLGWSYSLGVLGLFALLPGPLVDLFRPAQNPAVFLAARPTALFMLRLAAIYVMVEAIIVVYSGALRGAGDTVWAMAMAVGLHWLMLTVLWVMLYGLRWSPQAAWTVLVLLFLGFSGVFYGRYRTGKWRHIRVVADPVVTVALDHDQDFHGRADL